MGLMATETWNGVLSSDNLDAVNVEVVVGVDHPVFPYCLHPRQGSPPIPTFMPTWIVLTRTLFLSHMQVCATYNPDLLCRLAAWGCTPLHTHKHPLMGQQLFLKVGRCFLLISFLYLSKSSHYSAEN